VSKAETTAVLTNLAIGITSKSQKHYFTYENLSTEECEKILELLAPPSQFSSDRNTSTVNTDYPTRISTEDYKLDLVNYRNKLQKIIDSESNKAKKNSLEELAGMLFEAAHRFNVADKNFRTTSSEIDLIIEDETASINSNSRYAIVECKNWINPIGAPEIRNFKSKVKSHKSNLGIVFSKNGVTGSSVDGAEKDAQAEVTNAYKQDDILLAIFDINDLEVISKGTSFYTLLDKKIYRRRFRK
jgi:hypothetical protein